MKSQKGITLTSLIIYILIVIVIIAILTRLGIYFTSNVAEISEDSNNLAEMDVFNSYFLKDVKEEGNDIKNIIDPKLPAEYQEVEYIEGTGTQYIDTGLKDTKGWHVELGYEATKYGCKTSSWTQIIGTCNYINGTYYRSYIGIYPNHSFVLDVYSNYDSGVLATQLNKKYLIEASTYSGNSYLIIDGVKYKSLSKTFPEHDDSQGISILKNGDISSGKIYYCRFLDENGKQIRNFVPCYRKSDNVIGMYDIVDSVFYTNPGTGDFLKGSNIKDGVMPKIEFTNGAAYYFNYEENSVYYKINDQEIKLLNNVDSCTFNEKTENNKTIIVIDITINGKQDKKEYVLGSSDTYKEFNTEIAMEKIVEEVESTTRLPEEYQEIEYINATGQQYIDTGVIPNQTFSIEFKMQLDPNTGQMWIPLYGNNDINIRYRKGYNNVWYTYGTSSSNTSSGKVGIGNKAGILKQYKNNFGLPTSIQYNEFNSSTSIYLFTANGYHTVSYCQYNAEYFKMWYCKMWLNDELVRDYVPCYCKEEVIDVNGNTCEKGTVGLFDLVEKKFYKNAGTGEFIAGPDVN